MRKIVVEVDERQMRLQADADQSLEQRRQVRFAILMRSHGIFAGDSNKPKDGLVYQNELRAEWPE